MRLSFQLYWAMLSRLVSAILLPLSMALSVLLITPAVSAVERNCLQLFTVHSSRLQFNTSSKLKMVGLIQDGIDRLDFPLAMMEQPKLVVVEFPEILGDLAVYEPEYRLLRMRAFLSRDGYSDEDIRAMAQHEYGHAVFFANMGHYSRRWALWYRAINMDGVLGYLIYNKIGYKFHPGNAAYISEPYQELFSDLLAAVGEGRADAVDSIDRRLFKYSNSSRNFEGSLFDASWNENNFHDEFAPTRRFLWEQYFSKDKNKNQTAKMVRKVFEVIAREIILRSKEPGLLYITSTQANLRLLNLLKTELTEFE